METLLSPPLDLTTFAKPLLSPERVAALPRRSYDVVVIGAGVAGLAFTLRLPPGLRVALLTKGALGESNTRYAQGGLSAAIGADDSPELHEADTLAAGAGLCDPAAVRALVEGAPNAVRWLLEIGTRFDRDAASGELLLGREAAHSRRRVLHAGGDATGAEIERALVAEVRARQSVDVHERAFAIDLLLTDGRCAGLIAELAPGTGPARLEAPTVVIAAGGAGQLWATTSNPAGATADGLAMAIRAGAAIADVEFAQFHPTVLAVPKGEPFLVSEAVRGESAYLRDARGHRFMTGLHPLAELAPRDVVARGIQRQMALDGADHVSLDLRHLDGPAMHARFPTISRELARRGFDLAADLIPVAPAAHYFMGGLAAGTDGLTSLPGLLALGEASCTGVHGANRLASNSLLEGLVFGIAAADRLAGDIGRIGAAHEPGERFLDKLGMTVCRVGMTRHNPPRHSELVEESLSAQTNRRPNAPTKSRPTGHHHLPDLRTRLQSAMSRDVAVVRDAAGLRNAANVVSETLAALSAMPSDDRAAWELHNLALAAAAVVTGATLRRESRGAHFRVDFPETDPALAGRHLGFGRGAGWRFGALDDLRPTAGAAGTLYR